MNTLTTPCSAHCLCVQKAPEATKQIHARLSYEVGGQKFHEDLVAVVPADFHRGQWLMVLTCQVRDLIEPKGADFGTLDYQMDGGNAPVTWRTRLQDFWHRLTWRGKPFSGSYFVPIWPKPSANWPSPRLAS